MQYGELVDFLQNVGKDPSRLIFEDELTGLHNRRFLHSYFEHKIGWETEASFPLSLMVLDIDRFKKVNDTYGHDVGDEALKFVAGLLKEVAGETGYPVRFGGDEFMVILPKTELDHAVQHAHRLNQLTKERTLTLEGRNEELKISLSIGVASARDDAETGSDLIRIADTALYTSKALGRDRVSTAAEIDVEKTSRKTALHRLDGAEIAGRSRELAAVSEALRALSHQGDEMTEKVNPVQPNPNPETLQHAREVIAFEKAPDRNGQKRDAHPSHRRGGNEEPPGHLCCKSVHGLYLAKNATRNMITIRATGGSQR